MAFDPTLTTALLTAPTPTVAVLLGILLQRQEGRDLRVEIDCLRVVCEPIWFASEPGDADLF